VTFVSAGGSASLREKIAAAAPISGPFLVEKEQGQTANPLQRKGFPIVLIMP
jgi:hypothetical protein